MELNNNPYLAGLELVKKNEGTCGQTAVAKCILSLYNPQHGFSMAEILRGLDDRHTDVIMGMVEDFGKYGETEELRLAGSYVYDNFSRLVELSWASHHAKLELQEEWRRQHQKATLNQ